MGKAPPFSDVQKERRNVMVISVVMLLFMFATDGDVNNIGTINLLGNSKYITNPSVLFYFIWIYLIYSFVRYYLYTAPARTLYLNTVQGAVIVDNRFKEYLCSLLTEIPDVKPEKIGVLEDKITRKWGKRYVTAYLQSAPGFRRDKELSYMFIKKLELKYYILKTFSIRNPHGYHHLTDYMLPNLLFAFAMLWGINKYIWPKWGQSIAETIIKF